MNNKFTTRYIKQFFSSNVVRIILIIQVLSIIFSFPNGNIVYSNDFQWKLYLTNSHFWVFVFIKLPCFFTLVGKIYYDLYVKNEYNIRMKTKQNSLKYIDYIISKIVVYIYCFLMSFTIFYVALRSNNHFKSVLVPGILENAVLMFVINSIRMCIFTLILTKLQIFLLNYFRNKTISVIILILIDIFISFTSLIILPAPIEKIFPMSLTVENHLFKGLFDCIVTSGVIFLILFLVIRYINLSIVNKVDNIQK